MIPRAFLVHAIPTILALGGAMAAACGPPSESDPDVTEGELTASCAPKPPETCATSERPALDKPHGFRHLSSKLAALAGPNHHGRDQIYAVGDTQWILGKLGYGLVGKDLEDEDVDVWVERGCRGAWELLGTARTGDDHADRTIEGVRDGGGRVFFEVPTSKTLGVGRHHVRLVARGDNSSTDLLVDVVPKGAPLVVTDVDGTLTTSENAEVPALLRGRLPEAQPHAAEALAALAAKGYRIVYVTARSELLTERTRAFVKERGFPEGIIHTTTTLTGLRNAEAEAFKTDVLRRLMDRGLRIAWGFGNRASDTTVYDAVDIEPRGHRVFLGIDDPHGGRRVDGYDEILPAIAGSPNPCR